jgi:hypothetical protein
MLMVDSNERAPLKPSARDSARLGLSEVGVIAPGLIHARFSGKVKLEHMEPLVAAGDQQIASGHRVLIIADADDVHAYETEVRRLFQTWARANREHIEGVWVLFRSPLIKMGIGLINAVTNSAIRGFSDPGEFDAAVTEATARARAGGLRMGERPAVH